jgi:hypothetical protein
VDIDAREATGMTADADAASRAWTENVVRQRLAVDANRCCKELQRAGGQSGLGRRYPRHVHLSAC